MPEGHTLDRLARALDAAFAGPHRESLRASSPQGRFAAGAALLDGTVLDHAESWGKHLFLQFDTGSWLHVHLGLIGTFTVLRRAPAEDAGAAGSETNRADPDPPVTGAVRLRLLNREWVADLRGPMVCTVIEEVEVEAILNRLGPDPLREGAHADPDRAWVSIHRSSKPIAELLMDQSVLAGVGNVYRCEVLFRQRVHPLRAGNRIKRRTWEAIWADLRLLMPVGVATGRMVTITEQLDDVAARAARGEDVTLDSRDSYVYRRTDEACLVCGSRIRQTPVAGRALYWCGNCQRRS